MTTWKRTVRWADWDGNGLEHLSIVGNASGILARSVAIGQRDAHRFGLSYCLGIDPQWRARDVRIEILGGPKLHMLSDGEGCWRRTGGAEIPDLAGCVDIDFAATPFTNSLPIRRLAMAVGTARTIQVGYISLPALAISPVQQRYTRLTAQRYRYEGLSSSFAAELEVDAQGIVGDYPGVFRLVP